MDKNKRSTEESGQKTEKVVNKVINLRTPGTRRVQMKLDLNEKKAALTASILSIIALATFFNQKIVSHFDTSKSSRTIASLNEKAEFEFQWQKDLAQKLSQKSNRSIASYGERPSKLDEVRFGLLEGKYAFSFVDDKLSEIKFQETPNSDRPKYIKDVGAFLIENREALIPEVSLVKTLDSKSEGENFEQVFELYDAQNNNLGHATYISDRAGRFRSLKFVASRQ